MNETSQLPRQPTQRRRPAGWRQSFWRRLRARFGHKCNDLVPSNDVLQRLDLATARDLGRQTVPLKKIVGSSGRYLEFDLSFKPRRGRSERWQRVARAGVGVLPPVALYKVADVYFVEDGNHRVSVARAAGRATIAARVVELDATALRPEPACRRLGFHV